MPNNATGNPIFINATGGVFSANVDWYFNGIVVSASANSWAIILKDAAGRVIYQDASTATDDRPKSFAPAQSIKVTGLVVDTLTNINQAILYKG